MPTKVPSRNIIYSEKMISLTDRKESVSIVEKVMAEEVKEK